MILSSHGNQIMEIIRNKPTSRFSNIPVFSPKSARKPSNGHPYLNVFYLGFLSHVVSDLFKTI